MSQYIDTATGPLGPTARLSGKRWWGIAAVAALVVALAGGAVVLSTGQPTASEVGAATQPNVEPLSASAETLPLEVRAAFHTVYPDGFSAAKPEVPAQLRDAEVLDSIPGQPRVIAEPRYGGMASEPSEQPEVIADLRAAEMDTYFPGQAREELTAPREQEFPTRSQQPLEFP